MVAIDDPKLDCQDLGPRCLGRGLVGLWHHIDCLLVPLDIVNQIVNMSIHSYLLPQSDHPYVKRFLAFEGVFIQCEMVFKGP